MNLRTVYLYGKTLTKEACLPYFNYLIAHLLFHIFFVCVCVYMFWYLCGIRMHLYVGISHMYKGFACLYPALGLEMHITTPSFYMSAGIGTQVRLLGQQSPGVPAVCF